MIVSDKEAAARLNSPLNLMNRLRDSSSGKSSRSSAMNLFGVSRATADQTPATQPRTVVADLIPDNREYPVEVKFNPFKHETAIVAASTELHQDGTSTESPTTLDKILTNHEAQIKLGLVHDSALEVLTDTVATLKMRLHEINPSKLPSVITATTKVVETIRRERLEVAKNSKESDVHYHFYTPIQKEVRDYEVIEVG